MKIASPASSTFSLSTPAPAAVSVPQAPRNWSRWTSSPIARVEYQSGPMAAAWREAWLPADRSLTGALRPALTFGGSSLDAAIAAARALATRTTTIDVDGADGVARPLEITPAIAVLRDARAGVYWLAGLRTTVRSHGEWVEAPHSIDGAAFAGQPSPEVRSATRALVAVVGRDAVVTPSTWTNAPDDSRFDR